MDALIPYINIGSGQNIVVPNAQSATGCFCGMRLLIQYALCKAVYGFSE